MEDFRSGNEELDRAVERWLEWDRNGSETHSEVEEMVKAKQWSRLESIMLKRLSFGTAGIRGRMGPGFGQMNDLMVIQTTLGLGKYMLAAWKPEEAKARGAIVGFDGRHNSRRWARLVAKTLLNLGIRIKLFSETVPTPFVAFAVVHAKACVGVMITASHNPKDDNGYKVYCESGHQIVSPVDKKIQESILREVGPVGDAAFNADVSYDEIDVVDPLADVMASYTDTISKLMIPHARNAIQIVYTPMHGVGARYVDFAFEAVGFQPVIHVPEQKDPDPDFPTVPFPNPEEGKSALELAQKTADEFGLKYIVANDPDADRMALAEKLPSGQWKIFNGNEIGTLIGWWQFQVYTRHLCPEIERQKLHFIASTVSSKMLQTIAKKEGLTFHETLTGFKWMASKAKAIEEVPGNKVILAFEESIGYMCGTQVLDKDGIMAALRATELIAVLAGENKTLSEKLDDLYTEYGYHCSRISYFTYDDPEVLNKVFQPLRCHSGPDTYPTDVGGTYKVTDVRDLTTGYDSTEASGRAKLPVDPKTQMITFKFSNGIVATLRSSGTEPKLKYYIEYCASPTQSDRDGVEKDLLEFERLMVQDFLKPAENGLKSRIA